MPENANPAPGFAAHPDHTITVSPLGESVTVSVAGKPLAKSDKALLLQENTYPGVVYIPFDDIAFDRMEQTTTATHCPFKGDATYWRLADRPEDGDVMWAYQTPFDEMTGIRNHGAFYGNKVDIVLG